MAKKESKATATAKVTPLMKQYNGIKAKYPDACLLFRVGDFYETFGEDAIRASKILGIVLTKRGNGSETETALAGFPHHSLNTYLPKLVKAGLRVAICDQLEDPKMTKTIVKRGVTELVTPGVAMNDEVLQSKSNNFLAAVYFGKKQLGVAFLDISTGEFLTAQGNEEYIDKLLQNFAPSEILVSKSDKKRFNETFGTDNHSFFVEDWVFKFDFCYEKLTQHFETNSLKGFGSVYSTTTFFPFLTAGIEISFCIICARASDFIQKLINPGFTTSTFSIKSPCSILDRNSSAKSIGLLPNFFATTNATLVE